MSINKIFKLRINWKQKEKDGVLFEAVIDEKFFYLKINNFPEEPMYTVTNGSELKNFDDLPKNWSLNC